MTLNVINKGTRTRMADSLYAVYPQVQVHVIELVLQIVLFAKNRTVLVF